MMVLLCLGVIPKGTESATIYQITEDDFVQLLFCRAAATT
jgi:hypothetical protein